MERDASLDQSHRPSSWSAARRQGEAALLRALERASGTADEDTRDALRAFVEVLVAEGVTPEAAVIALKEAILRAHFLFRYEPMVREHLRTTLVSECIDHYFLVRTPDDALQVPRAGQRALDSSRDGDAGRSLRE
jgi:hypothetical protein